jgi:hypothetical protein
VLVARDQQDNKETGRTNTHKLCVLVDRKLQSEYGRDVLLPTYWYKYGKTISEADLNTAVVHRPRSDRTYGYSYYPADQVSETDFEHLGEELKNDIYYAVQKVVDEHGNKTIEELEEYQYKNFRPDEFIEAYGDLRWDLAKFVVDDKQQTFAQFLDKDQKSTIEDHLDRMLATFPSEEYEEIHHIYLEWDDTIRLLHEQRYNPGTLKEFAELFIEGLAKAVLRLKYNNNIPDERLAKWQAEKDETLADLADRIRRKRKDALQHRDEAGMLDRLAEPYNETILDEIDDV